MPPAGNHIRDKEKKAKIVKEKKAKKIKKVRVISGLCGGWEQRVFMMKATLVLLLSCF